MTKIIDRWYFHLVLQIINCHRMDSNQDGMITYDEFVQCVKTSGDSDLYRWILLTNNNFSQIHRAGDVCGVLTFLIHPIVHLLRYIEPVMSVGFTVMGFFVYSVSLYVGLSVAWFVYLSTFVYQRGLVCIFINVYHLTYKQLFARHQLSSVLKPDNGTRCKML